MASTDEEAVRCECQKTARLLPGLEWLYTEEELPGTTHLPGLCTGTNDIQRYTQADGQVRWLCSCCNVPGDILCVETSAETVPSAEAV